nr:hypothetical protein [Rhodococcus opacus]
MTRPSSLVTGDRLEGALVVATATGSVGLTAAAPAAGATTIGGPEAAAPPAQRVGGRCAGTGHQGRAAGLRERRRGDLDGDGRAWHRFSRAGRPARGQSLYDGGHQGSSRPSSQTGSTSNVACSRRPFLRTGCAPVSAEMISCAVWHP